MRHSFAATNSMRDLIARRAALRFCLTAPALLLTPAPKPMLAAQPPPGNGKQTRSGLQFIDFREGSGPTPRFGQLVRFNYVTYLLKQDGNQALKVVDSTYDRTPYLTKHGNGLTCQGIEEALHTMKVGGRRRIVLPPVLGFTTDKGPTPPYGFARDELLTAVERSETLVFDLELVSILDDVVDRGDYDDMSMEEVDEVLAKMIKDGQLTGPKSNPLVVKPVM